MYKRVLLCLMLCCCLAMCFATSLAEEAEENLLYNGSFEIIGADGMPDGWYTDQYNRQEGYTNFAVLTGDAQEGEHSVQIENLGDNDARFAQRVEVKPESLYCLSGYIRAEQIPDSGLGANLSVEGLYVFSESVYDTAGEWQYVELYGETGPEQTEVTVFARLGGYSGESRGTAAFDNLSLREVNIVPGDGVASLWFEPDVQETVIEPVQEGEADPFWPWLLVISALYALAALVACDVMMRRREKEPLVPMGKKKHTPAFLVIALIVAALARVVVACLVSGYQVDVNCFRAWGASMTQLGPAGFYAADQFCDYPPAYLYVLWLDNGMINLLNGITPAGFASWFATLGIGSYYDVMSVLVIKLVPMACDLGASYLLYRVGREKLGDRPAAVLAALMAFNPAFFLNSAAWCQMDSVLCLLLALVALTAMRRNWRAALPLYMLCVLVKPQALMLGFLGLLAMGIVWAKHREDRRAMLQGAGIAVLTALVVVLPFSLGSGLNWNWLFTLYSNTLASYSYATVNMANLYYLFDGNWVSTTISAGWQLPVAFALLCAAWSAVTWIRQRGKLRWFWVEPAAMACFAVYYLVAAFVQPAYTWLGVPAMALCILLTLGMYLRGGKLENLPLAGGMLFMLLCVFGLKMHERYLFPALLFFALAFLQHRDWRILLLMICGTLTIFVNAGIVLDNSLRLGSSMGHLNNDTLWLNDLISLVNVLSALLAVWTGQRVMVENQPQQAHGGLRLGKPVQLPAKPGNVLDLRYDAGLHWKRVDAVLVAAVTLVYGALALCNLGSIKAPQNPWKSTDATEQVVIDLGAHYDDFRMLYFAQVSYSGFSVAFSEDGELWSEEYWAQMDQGQCFRWMYLTPYTVNANGQRTYDGYGTPRSLSGRYVRITAQQIGLILDEVIFRLEDQTVLPAQVVSRVHANEASTLFSDPENLLDEQDTLEGEPSWYNSTYFDEIYHARTAFELLNGTSVYEWTHPPLGKVLMSWCIALFGMTPFGWRFAGCMAGILMLPFMYLLAKQLTKRRDLAFAAMALLALDCMHLTQTRIATIDSFPVLFIMMSFFFMLRFMQRDLMAGMKPMLTDLAWSGVSIGLGIASKWIGLYAGAGLAVLFFWTCWRHIRLSYQAKELLSTAGGLSKDQREALIRRSRETLTRLVWLCLWCVAFFILVPVAIYLLSYIPQMACYGKLSLRDFLEKVIRVQQDMYNYHSTPGLGMDHPFYSPWYEWLFIKRPMYFASDRYVPAGYGYAIFCFGNPAVWIGGLVGILVCALIWCRGHVYEIQGQEGALHWQSMVSHKYAFVIIGLLAQLLPWILVPRGTYIYHYFASVPFLVLGATLTIEWIQQGRWPRLGRALTVAYLVFALICFIGFYPYASGVTTPTWWLDFMKQFLLIYY